MTAAATPPTDRRRHDRHAVDVPIALFLGPRGIEQPAQLVDLGMGGMRIEVANLTVDKTVKLHVHVARADGRGATALGRVVRVDRHGIAFRFDHVRAQDGELLATGAFGQEADRLYVAPIDTPRWWVRWWSPLSPSDPTGLARAALSL
jgi:hypothetical protein